MKENKFNYKKMIIKIVISLLIIGLILLGGYLLLKHFNLLDLSQEQLQEIVSSYGALGPIVFIFISFLQVTFVPIPGAVTILCGNYLFGPVLSFIYSYIGMFIGGLLAFVLGRVIGRPFVNWVAGDKETVDYYLEKLKGKEVIVLFFMFLLPVFPDDLLCSVAGIMPTISYPVFIIMQLITRATSIFGTLLFMSGEYIPLYGWGLFIIIPLGIIAIIAFIYSMKNSDKINDKLISTIDKIFKKKNK